MRRLIPLTVIACLAALPALSQEPQKRPGGQGKGGFGAFGGRMGGVSSGQLLTQKSVQDELKLSEEQLKKVTEVGEKQKKAMDDLKGAEPQERFKKMMEITQANEKAYAEVLKPEQTKRLKQVSLQVQGVRALANPELAKEVGLTEEQREKMRTIQAEASKEMFAGGGFGANPDEMRKKIEEMNKGINEKLLTALTAEQKTKWKEMTGEPFKGKVELTFPGAVRKPPE